jgi:FixJ family two-component response regulator
MTEVAPTIIVIDDDYSVREAIEGLLCSVGLRTAMHESVDSYLAAKLPEGPHCLVLDVRLPGQSGLDLQASLAKGGRSPPVIFITGHGDIQMSVRAMKAGAVEFLTKPFRDQDLLDAIQLALDTDRQRLAKNTQADALRKQFDSLTAREREVMAFVATGRLNKQIAADLGVSEITVKMHRGQVMRKMSARSVADLVRMADGLGLEAPGA